MVSHDRTEEATDVRIGSLLALSGLVRATDLEEALAVATQTGLPVGRILVMSNRISEETLRTVLDVQTLIRDGTLPKEQALDAVKTARRSNRSLIEVLEEMGHHRPQQPTTRLGDLLVECGQLTEEQLRRALAIGSATGLPIGRVLVLLGQIPEPMANRALQLQEEIRRGNMTRAAAVNTFKLERIRLLGIKSREAEKTNRVKIGELLVMAEVLSKSDVDAALEMAEANNKMVGEVLTELDWLSEDMLIAALKVQQKVWQKELEQDDAVQILKEVYTTGAPLEMVEQRKRTYVPTFQKTITLFEFLKVTGFMTRRRLTELIEVCIANDKLLQKILQYSGVTDNYTPELLRRAIKTAITDSLLLSEILVETGVVDKEVVSSSEGLCELVRQGALPIDKAIVAFTYCHDFRIPVAEAIGQLGFPVK